MNLLIGNQTVELNFKTEQDALNTRALIMMAYQDAGMNAYFNWTMLVKKYPILQKSYSKATNKSK